MSSTRHHLLLDFFWQVISGPPCIYNGRFFFKFGVEVGVELSIVNALYRLRHTDQLFTRVVRSQSTLQPLLPRQILKNTLYTYK
jgi:hypothetical protein